MRPSARRVLAACGWLAADAVEGSDFTQADLSRSHSVTLVRRKDGCAAVVKLGRPLPESPERGLDRELFVYRLAGWLPELAAVLPEPLLLDEQRQALAMVAVASGRADPPSIAIEAVAGLLGRAMAAWHRATAAMPMRPSLAEGILELPDAAEEACRGRTEAGAAYLRLIAADTELAGALREARRLYRRLCLIHGDVRSDNLALEVAEDPPALKVLDWELAGAGDPAWDLASIGAEAVVSAVRTSASGQLAPKVGDEVLERTMAPAVAAYLGSDDPVPDGREHLAKRLTLFIVARLLHIGSEWAELQRPVELGPAAAPLAEARALLRSRAELDRLVEGWIGS